MKSREIDDKDIESVASAPPARNLRRQSLLPPPSPSPLKSTAQRTRHAPKPRPPPASTESSCSGDASAKSETPQRNNRRRMSSSCQPESAQLSGIRSSGVATSRSRGQTPVVISSPASTQPLPTAQPLAMPPIPAAAPEMIEAGSKKPDKRRRRPDDFPPDAPLFRTPRRSSPAPPLLVCSFCLGDERKNRDGAPEDLIACHDCGRSGHPTCLKWSRALYLRVRRYPWLCIECKRCAVCLTENLRDRNLLFCDWCDSGYHLSCCQPPLEQPPEGRWLCRSCNGLRKAVRRSRMLQRRAAAGKDMEEALDTSGSDCSDDSSASTSVKKKKKRKIIDNAKKPAKVPRICSKIVSDLNSDVGSSSDDQKRRAPSKKMPKLVLKLKKQPQNLHQQQQRLKLKKLLKLSKEGKSVKTGLKGVRGTQKQKLKLKDKMKEKLLKKRRGRDLQGLFDGLSHLYQAGRRKGRRHHQPEESAAGGSGSSEDAQPVDESSAADATTEEAVVEEDPVPEEDLLLFQSVRTACTSNSVAAVPVITAMPQVVTDSASVSEDAPLAFACSLATAAAAAAGQALPQSIQIGEHRISTWYSAPYPQEYLHLPVLYICPFCLKYMKCNQVLSRHMGKCELRHPPADEIYRSGDLSVFEVDGQTSKLYCQNLCLLAKLFLDHKTLYYDVEPFLFYVLCRKEADGWHLVGYFSKEKRSAQKHNVSCIMTFPCYQRHGYGRFLIHFSYLLSRREGVTGSPEKPLSDLGRISYQAYWEATVLEWLDTRRPLSAPFSLAELCQDTGLDARDAAATMQRLGLLHRRSETGQLEARISAAWLRDFMRRTEAKRRRRIALDEEALRWVPVVNRPAAHYQHGYTHSLASPDSSGGGCASAFSSPIREQQHKVSSSHSLRQQQTHLPAASPKATQRPPLPPLLPPPPAPSVSSPRHLHQHQPSSSSSASSVASGRRSQQQQQQVSDLAVSSADFGGSSGAVASPNRSVVVC